MPEVMKHIKELEQALGPNRVYTDVANRIAHRMSHSPEILLHKDRTKDFLPDAVVCPESTEDVVELVKFANKYKIPLIPQGGRIGTQGSQGRRGGIAVSLHRMDKILDFDEENQLVTVEPGVRTGHLGEFLTKKGCVIVEYPATRSACQGGRIGTGGYNRYQFAIGETKNNASVLEVVLPDGSIAELGDGGCRSSKTAMGYNLRDLIVGSRGTLGIVTKITQRCYKRPPIEDWGYSAFSTPEDMVRALIDVCQDPITSFWTWRLTGSPHWVLKEVFKTFMGREAPKEIGALLDYNVFGDSAIVESTEKRLKEIFAKYGGFLSNSLPPEKAFGKAAYTNRDIAINRFAALTEARATHGGKGGEWLPVDPAIPNSNAVAYMTEGGKIRENWEKLYPVLAKSCKFFPGMAVNVNQHCIFFYGVFVFDMEIWDKEMVDEFIKFYREHADLVHRLGGSMTYVHGFAPRIVEVEMIKEEVGEAGYELMKKIKKALDPNNIMNPYVRFTYEEDPALQAALEGR